MDLSSLGGAAMVNPKFIVQPDTTTPRVQANSSASIQYLFSKPLPPRPSSTGATSPTQHRNTRQNRSPNRSPIDANLRWAEARGRPIGPPDELFLNHEYEVRPRIQHIPHSPPRSRSCVPITWLEHEKKWIVGEIYVHGAYDAQPQDDTASSPVSPISPVRPWRDVFQRFDEHIDYNNRLRREDLLVQPPPYDEHGFIQTYDAALGDDRVSSWVRIAQRMHEERRNWA
ncbi:hypothetical protein DTO013E5_9101 [Penicillium roqueforti]|uniref:Uncharacterized protein n=1 Tax=Penicillium roqueforti (strain FM164) TaxID=1365484 RepID=W6Q9L2_PENRF|nr:uncharacterized protein LCP9604111_2960 [Penicillium roqueforti]CDM33318.1 hypothetical protein PROQFM164_S03g000042 [Penicillium roqueforti FM164]KAF9250756.1 hypothetical protein LCP9604111_2960 [Penicillium roqueforti]KAI1836753.1 hypothetical protein CBS147337_2005 [Penicillium roqueforti]KAI2677812.1 hypothetical protein CBS147355_4813 [Penicillium roqueforti]KAI2686837.1 hypothetical protein LCP963914a_4437 [Penicillium roqueforti]